MIDARKGLDAENEAIVTKLPEVPGRKFLLLNKVDVVAKPDAAGAGNGAE